METQEMILCYYDVLGASTNLERIPDGINIIGAPEFWGKGKKGEGIVIAIIDTGCDINHPDLKDRIIGVKNFTNDDGGKADVVTDSVGHGTHVAGIIAGSENGSGIIGVAPLAKLLILKALSKGGGKYNWVTNAVNYAVSKKVNIISMSLGGKIDDFNLHKAIINAVNNNISVVCAAGNDGDNKYTTREINYPAAYNEVISVGSINFEKRSSKFSASNNEIDLVAPGQGYGDKGILSTAPGGGYVEMQGTSMAAPHVSGALALIINWANEVFGRHLSEAEIYAQLIRKTVSLGYDKSIEGNGMIYLMTDEIVSKAVKDMNFSQPIQK
jgi:major intracellular serine protease